MSQRQALLGVLAGVGASAIWGGMYVVSDVVLEVIPPFTLLTLRLLVAIPLLAVALGFTGWPRLNRRQVMRLAGVGLVGYGVSLGAQFVGTRLSTAANGALVTTATPAFVAFFAALLLGEQMTLPRMGALALATAGVAVVVNPAQANLSSETLWGNLVLFVAGVTWGLYSVLAKAESRQHSTLTVTVVAMAGGLLLAVPAATLELARSPVGPLTPGTLLGVLYLGVVASAVAMVLWTWCFERLEASIAGLTFFAQPVVGALLGVLLLGERLSPSFFVGGGLIVAGVVLVTMWGGRPADVPA